MPGFSMIYSTFGNQESAEKAAKKLLEKRLIGCAVFFPAKSMYWWKGQLETAQEAILLAKTIKSKSVNVQKELEKIHPYETPCIIEISSKANPGYLQWLMKETTMPKKQKKK
jgi:periplasmic divalent cation tolerance protein